MKRVVYSQTSPIYNTINDQNGQPEESITQGKCNALCKLSYIHSTFSFLKLIGFGLSAKEDGDFKVQQLRIHKKKKKKSTTIKKIIWAPEILIMELPQSAHNKSGCLHQPHFLINFHKSSV